MILGIDIGGANTKVASSDGRLVELHYIPLWKNTTLREVLLDIAKRLKPEKVAVVITGELADCFPDKETGISYIIDAANDAFTDAYFLDSSGVFTKEKNASWQQQTGWHQRSLWEGSIRIVYSWIQARPLRI